MNRGGHLLIKKFPQCDCFGNPHFAYKQHNLHYAQTPRVSYLHKVYSKPWFYTSIVLQDFTSRGLINELNFLPLSAFSPIDTVHKNKCSDKRFSYIENCFRRVLLNNDSTLFNQSDP